MERCLLDIVNVLLQIMLFSEVFYFKVQLYKQIKFKKEFVRILAAGIHILHISIGIKMDTKIALAIAVTSVMIAVAVAPTLAVQKVFADPPPPTITTTCTNHGGHTSSGECTGNTGSNQKEETTTCTAKNSGLQKKLCPP